jgi:hypothetical protein
MTAWICKVFGHKWQEGSVGTMCAYFGAVVVNYKTCERCGKSEHEYRTVMKEIEI